MEKRIYTIGYAGFPLEDFCRTLTAHGVGLLADVRSKPYSGYYTDYDRENLNRTLRNRAIVYRHMADAFGARQGRRSLYSPAGYLDFEKAARTPQFLGAVEALTALMDEGVYTALMCAEKDPISCHRAILVARAFSDAGCQVLHLLPEGGVLTQGELEARLLDEYFPDREQLSLFDEAADETAYIARAYRLKNAEIGYREEAAE